MKNAKGIEMEEIVLDHETFKQAFTEYFERRGKQLESIGSIQGQTGYIANLTPVTPKQITVWFCPDCGSTDVMYMVWWNPNTDTVGESAGEDSSEDYCCTCREHVSLLSYTAEGEVPEKVQTLGVHKECSGLIFPGDGSYGQCAECCLPVDEHEVDHETFKRALAELRRTT